MIVSTSLPALGLGKVSSIAHDGKLCECDSANAVSDSGLTATPNGPDCDRYDDNFGRSPLLGVGGLGEVGERKSWSTSVTSINGVRDLDGGILRSHGGMSAIAITRRCFDKAEAMVCRKSAARETKFW